MQVENELVAHTVVLFADVRETYGWKVLRGKMDAVLASMLISGHASILDEIQLYFTYENKGHKSKVLSVKLH